MRVAIVLIAIASAGAPLGAQSTAPLATSELSISETKTGAPYRVPLAFQSSAQSSAGTGFVMEWLGGTAGSAAAFGLGIALANCDADEDDFLNIDCAINAALVTVLVSIPASVVGAYFLGQAVDSRPSAGGAFIGSVVGMVGGMLVVNALDSDSSENDVALVLGYAATQGLLTAIGSRIGAALR